MIDAQIIDWWTDSLPPENGPQMVLMTATIGQKGFEGGNNFNLIVCNPEWIAERVRGTRGFWPKGYLIVDEVDSEHVERAVAALIQNFAKSETWNQFCERLNRFMDWEYEDYNDGQGLPEVPN